MSGRGDALVLLGTAAGGLAVAPTRAVGLAAGSGDGFPIGPVMQARCGDALICHSAAVAAGQLPETVVDAGGGRDAGLIPAVLACGGKLPFALGENGYSIGGDVLSAPRAVEVLDDSRGNAGGVFCADGVEEMLMEYCFCNNGAVGEAAQAERAVRIGEISYRVDLPVVECIPVVRLSMHVHLVAGVVVAAPILPGHSRTTWADRGLDIHRSTRQRLVGEQRKSG